MTNVDFYQSRLSNSDCCNLLFKRVLCAHTHVCVCVSTCLFQVMDTIHFGLHSANDSPKTAAPCEPHNEMPHESHRALTSDTMPHWENLSPSHLNYVAGYPQSLYYSIRPPAFDKQSPQHIYQVSEQWQLRFNVMQDRAANFVKLKIKYRLLPWQPLCSFSPQVVTKALKQTRIVFLH